MRLDVDAIAEAAKVLGPRNPVHIERGAESLIEGAAEYEAAADHELASVGRRGPGTRRPRF